MKQQKATFKPGDIIVALVLILITVISRWALCDFPNFKPVAATAVFAGFYFRNVWLAVIVPCVSMLLSDAFLGGYEWQIALVVYACFIGSVFWGRHAVGGLKAENDKKTMRFPAVLAAPLVTATAFFVLTNIATWLFSGWYEVSISGLANCFVAAIPFYKYTLAGDLFFTWTLFGMHLMVSQFARRIVARTNAMA